MSCKSLKKPKLDNVGNEVISIGVGVGNKRQTFSIHKNLLQNVTRYFDKLLETETGSKGLVFLNDSDPEVFGLFRDWIYTGIIPKAPTTIPFSKIPTPAQIQKLEEDLRKRFDAHISKLVFLYLLGQDYSIEALQNKTIDNIQDGFFEFGTVFGPGTMARIFNQTKRNSPLRDLVVAANVMHIDRGCSQLRQELVTVSLMCPDFLPHVFKWMSRNFSMFGRRATEGYDVHNRNQGFTLLNRSKLCPCHFHIHTKGGAHANHAKCAVPYVSCGHGENDDDISFDLADTLASLIGFNPDQVPLQVNIHN